MKQQKKDPVCGMTIEIDDTTLCSDWQDATYYFCAPACKEKFDDEPEQYAGKKECCGRHKHSGHHNHGGCHHHHHHH